MTGSEDRGAFVYAVKVDGVVRYIGKGRRSRHTHHAANARRVLARRALGEDVRTGRFLTLLCEAVADGADVQSDILFGGLTDQEALRLEREMIGSDEDGVLWNQCKTAAGLHPAAAREIWARPGYREKMAEISRQRWRKNGFRERYAAAMQPHRSNWSPDEMAERARRMWGSPDAVERYRAAVSAPDYRKAASDRRMAQLTADERAAFGARIKASWADPEKRAARIAHMSSRMKAKNADGPQARLLDVVRAHPGIDYDDAKEISGLKTINAQVYALKRAGLVRSEQKSLFPITD